MSRVNNTDTQYRLINPECYLWELLQGFDMNESSDIVLSIDSK